jgi:nucleoside-diphosphate-sugar epimerase
MPPEPCDDDELEEWLSQPLPGVTEALESLEGDLLILGAGGKMGPTLARMARRALPVGRQVLAVSRFSSSEARSRLEKQGIRTLACDLLDRAALEHLPDVANIIFMAGHKFGSSDNPGLTWRMNAVLPALVAERFAGARTVVFSTGCVYPFVPVDSGGAREDTPLGPPGEYAHSCIARERLFTDASLRLGTPCLIFRLNYAIDLRYGVLHDIARKVWAGEPVDVTCGYVNVIWQGDACARALQCLPRTSTPPEVLNVTGSETLSVRDLAERFGRLFDRTPRFTGTEAPTAWLADAGKSIDWFGEPSIGLERMIEATAAWIRRGGNSLGKPTHFESRDGRF